MKKIAAVLIIIVLLGGWYITIFGAGDTIKPIKEQIKLGLDLKGGVYVVMEADTDLKGTELARLMSQTQAVIEERVNQLGLSEPVVSIEGENRIRVELPGAEDADEAISLIGQTAQLQFILADGTVVLDGSQVKDAGIALSDQSAGYAVTLEFDSAGALAFEEATKKIIDGQVTSSMEGINANQIMIVLDNAIQSAPAVSNVITGGRCEITGNFTQQDATNLAALIRGGALPVPLKEVQTSVIGPTLGLDSLEESIAAGIIGVIIILLLMVVVYRIMGVAADIAVFLYILMFLWVIVALKAVLTLPGVAGMILSVGMAVDANVIIFSRIREEVNNGKTIRVATSSGFKRAISTVMDSQITTLIAGLALYQFGSGSVKGFALTLMIGIILSLFTAVVVTHLYLEIIADNRILAKNKLFGIKEAKNVREA